MENLMFLINAIIQVFLFTLIPFVWWLISGRKKANFFSWIGLKKPIIKSKRQYIICFILTVSLFITVAIITPLLVNTSDIATSQFQGKGFGVLFKALVYSFIQTSLSEEILFRGFLAKRFIHKFSFSIGNVIQALLFGLMHGIMFVSVVGLSESVMIILITGLIGWIMGYINEKQSDNSIISSWLLHGVANTLSSILAMFNII